MENYFSVAKVRAAECTLEPMNCIYCGSLEVTFHQYVNDACCAECGEWQVDD